MRTYGTVQRPIKVYKNLGMECFVELTGNLARYVRTSDREFSESQREIP